MQAELVGINQESDAGVLRRDASAISESPPSFLKHHQYDLGS
jgi:hypothetical protein